MIPAMVQAFKTKQQWLPKIALDVLKQWLQGSINEWKGKRLLMPERPDHSSKQTAGTPKRREAIDRYIDEVFRMTGRKITRTDIWKAARYKTRTEFERWERYDKRATKAADERFLGILAEKPHLR
jgi:hypothetical protein